MAWITEAQADEYLSPNQQWEEFANKDELLTLASNRLDQLTFKDEPINRVGAKYTDGTSVDKETGTTKYLLDSQAGNWEYHEALGWERNTPDFDLIVFEGEVAFFMNIISAGARGNAVKDLTFRDIQTLHSFGGLIGGFITLDAFNGTAGCASFIETQQANAIVDSEGEQVFLEYPNRRLGVTFKHNEVNLFIVAYEGTPEIILDGVTQVNVINELGVEVVNTVPSVSALEYFTYSFVVNNGLDKTIYLYVNDILVANPVFHQNTDGSSLFGNRIIYSSGLPGSTISTSRKRSYVRRFGAEINTENPTTIPIRLVAASALLALEYGKYPPNFIGDKEYLENENDYSRMQDLPINVQSAVEPFLADYRETENVIEPKEVDRVEHAQSLEYT